MYVIFVEPMIGGGPNYNISCPAQGISTRADVYVGCLSICISIVCVHEAIWLANEYREEKTSLVLRTDLFEMLNEEY